MWRRPPSWIPKSCCHLFTIRPMRTNFDGNVVNLIWNALYRQEMQIHQKSRWRLPPSWIRWRLPPSWISKNFCNSFTIWPILTKQLAQWLIQRWRLPPYWLSKRCGHSITIKPFLTKHVVNIKYWPAGRKTAYINVKNYSSCKRGVYRPDSTYKTAKLVYQKYSH